MSDSEFPSVYDMNMEQLEERLDFVERVLGRTREAQKLEP